MFDLLLFVFRILKAKACINTFIELYEKIVYFYYCTYLPVIMLFDKVVIKLLFVPILYITCFSENLKELSV